MNILKIYLIQVERLCKKLPTAIDSATEAKEAFEQLNNAADPLKVAEWELQELQAKLNRNLNPEAMDIYDIKAKPGEWLYIVEHNAKMINGNLTYSKKQGPSTS